MEPEIDQNVILKFSWVISLVCNKDTDIEALAPASVFHYYIVLSFYCHDVRLSVCLSVWIGLACIVILRWTLARFEFMVG